HPPTGASPGALIVIARRIIIAGRRRDVTLPVRKHVVDEPCHTQLRRKRWGGDETDHHKEDHAWDRILHLCSLLSPLHLNLCHSGPSMQAPSATNRRPRTTCFFGDPSRVCCLGYVSCVSVRSDPDRSMLTIGNDQCGLLARVASHNRSPPAVAGRPPGRRLASTAARRCPTSS